MRNPIIRLAAGMAAALLLAANAAHSQEEKVALAKVPKPVLSAAKAHFVDSEVTGASKETENGKLVYEVTIKHKGQNIDVTLTPEGEIILIEKEIAAKTLPASVASALQGKYPKAMYKIVEEIIKVEKKREKLAYYEVLLVKTDKKWLEVQVTPEGKIAHEEQKKPGGEDGSSLR